MITVDADNGEVITYEEDGRKANASRPFVSENVFLPALLFGWNKLFRNLKTFFLVG